MTEIWKDCVGWEDYYQVSNFGNVKSKRRNKILRLYNTTKGYKAITFQVTLADGTLIQKGKKVHCLVLESFVGHRPEGYQACHNDGCRFNNNLTNLRWDTVKNNEADKRLHGTMLIGIKNPRAKLNENQVTYIKKSEISKRKLAEMFDVSRTCIAKIKSNKLWTHV